MSFNPSNYLYQPDQGQQDDYFNQALGSMNQFPNAGQLPYMRYGGFGSGSDSGLPDPTFYQQQGQPQDQMQGQQNTDYWHTPTGQGYYTDEFGQQQPITPISFAPTGNGPFGGNVFNGQQTDFGPVDGQGQGSDFSGFQQQLNANQGLSTTMPVGQSDVYGAAGMGGGQSQGDFNSALAGLGQSTGLNNLPTLTRSDNPNPSVDNPAAVPGAGSTTNPNQGIQPPPPPPGNGSPYPGANGINSNYQFQDGVDYSKVGAINYTDFQGNAYAKANANRLPAELDPNTSLAGGIDQNKYAALKSQYGYQMAQNGIADYNQAERMLYAAGRQDPNSDYYLVDVAGGGYAILKRARTAQGQIDAGFTPPSMRPAATNQNTGSGNGRSFGSQYAGGGVKPPTPPVPLAPNGKPYANPSSFTGMPEGYPAQGTGAMGMAGMMGPNHRDPNTGQVSPNYPNYQAKDGDTRYNLQTGQQEVYQNGQWVVKPQGGGGGGHPTPMTR